MKIGETKLNLAEMQPNRLSARCAGFGLILWTSGANRRFKFHKRSQLFIGVHNETLSVAADVRPQRSSFARENPRLSHHRGPNMMLESTVETCAGYIFCCYLRERLPLGCR
jgi:hypothetical protein